MNLFAHLKMFPLIKCYLIIDYIYLYLTERGATKLKNKWLPIDRKWREEHGLPKNSNSFGPLTNLPDYTFLDGRPTPLGVSAKS